MIESTERANLKTIELFDLTGLTGPVVEMIEEMKRRNSKEIHSTEINGVTYLYPLPEAIEEKLYELYGKTDSRDSAEDRKELLEFIDRLVASLKRGVDALGKAERDWALARSSENKSGFDYWMVQARSSFADAWKVLKEQEDPKQTIDWRNKKDREMEEDLFGPDKKDKPTIH